MKKEDFLKLMDGIDDRLVEKYAISDEAEAKQKQIRRQRRQRWLNQVTGCAVAAIILGVIGVAMLCASFGVVRMDRQSPKTPVSLGDGNEFFKIMRIMEMRKKSFWYRHTFLILEWRSRTFRKSKR